MHKQKLMTHLVTGRLQGEAQAGLRLAVAGVAALLAFSSVSAADTNVPAVSISRVSCVVESSVGYAQYPSLASSGDGTAWLCWLSRFSGGTEQVMVQAFNRGAWEKPSPVEAAGKYETPVIACAKNGKPMVAWVAINAGKWEIFASQYTDNKFAAPQLAVSSEPGRCRNPALVAGKDGTFFLAWEAYRNGAFRIYAKAFNGKQWGKAVEAGDPGFNCYNPALCIQSNALWLAYSKAYKAKSGMRDLILCDLDLNTLAVKQKRVAASGARMSYPSLTADRLGRLWLSAVYLGGGNQFGASSFALCFDKGAFLIPESMTPATVPVRSDPFAQKKSTVTLPFIPGGNATLPVLIEDRDKHLVALTREAMPDSPGQPYTGRRAWGITASIMTDKGWSEPCRLIDALQAGRKDHLGAVDLGDGTVLLVWQQDTVFRLTQEKQNVQVPIPYERSGTWISTIYSGILKVSEKLPAVDAIALKKFDVPAVQPVADELVQRPPQATFSHAGAEYSILWGNIHEHSDFSTCSVLGLDGSLDDNYRHHLDAAPYDFCSITDHSKCLNEFMWRASMRASDFYNDPPYFIAFPGNENARSFITAEDFNANLEKSGTAEAVKRFSVTNSPEGTGHYNIFFPSSSEAEKSIGPESSGGPTMLSNTMDGFFGIAGMCARLRELKANAIVIPHQLACPDGFADWNAFKPDFMPVCEIFQARGSYEYYGAPGTKEARATKTKQEGNRKGHYVHDAFAKGLKFGFIASGDHANTGHASTAVFVKEKTPEGIFEALRQARCYATSTPGYEIMLDFSANGHFMGERARDASEQVKIVANIKTKYPITSIAVFKNGTDLLADKKLGVGDTQAKVELTDKPTEDECYYYLRVVTEKGIAWTSPVWITRK